MTDPTEALARALATYEPIPPSVQREAKRVTANLAALGYEVRPIEKRCNCPESGTSGSCPFHDSWSSIAQAAEAADREAAGRGADARVRIENNPATPSAVVAPPSWFRPHVCAPLDVEALAAAWRDEHTAPDGGADDCGYPADHLDEMIAAAYADAIRKRGGA